MRNLKSYNISKNRSNIEIKDEILVNYLTEVGLQVKNESEKLGIFEKYYPKLKRKYNVMILSLPIQKIQLQIKGIHFVTGT